MPTLAETVVYTLCAIASALCAVLLAMGYRQTRSRLLMWITISFIFLALSNLVVVVEQVIIPEAHLHFTGKAMALIAVGVLIYAFVWEVDQ